MCTSRNEFRALNDDYTVSLMENSSMSIGLMEGFLTLPISPKTRYSISRYYDWDPDPATYLWWNKRVGEDTFNHMGIDYDTRQGEDVLAPAPGIFFGGIQRGPEGQVGIALHHPDAELTTFYNHLSKVVVTDGQHVSRGEKIAETGSTGTSFPHLHFNTAKGMGSHDAFLDPYRPLFALDDWNNGYWAREQGKDFWQRVRGSINPNLENFWTKDNDPQYSA